MSTTINIKFDNNPHGVYFNGEIVSGKVEISFAKKKIVRGIAIQIRGFAKVRWDESFRKRNVQKKRSSYYDYYGKEEYISNIIYLVRSEDGTRVEFAPGSYIYSFSYTLSHGLPSSFEGNFGHIRYVTKVILDRPWKFDRTYSMGFTVIRKLDLNQHSTLLQTPSEVESIQTFWCGLCTSKPLQMTVSLPQTGYVPGQIIHIRAEINNTSNIDVSQVRFYLRSIISYHAQQVRFAYTEEVIDVLCLTAGQVLRKSCVKFEESLLIPALPASSDATHSKIIQINYEIRVEAITPRFHKNPFLVCPIKIGTIPLMNSLPPYETLMNQTNVGQSERGQSGRVTGEPNSTSQPSSAYAIPPPSYEEAVNITRAQVDDHELHPTQRTDFLPRYPVYNLQETASGST